MEKLRTYLNHRTTDEQFHFARRCGTTIGYLRRRISDRGNIGPGIVMAIERESGGEVRCEDLRPYIDWSVLRRRTRAA